MKKVKVQYKGFPGWHIECSAMATKYLGKHFDIHTGGEDHALLHHENEIAQSESALNVRPWVHVWMHGAFLVFGDEKMSKSSGKILRLHDLELKGIPPLAYKYFTYTAHYRKPLNWGWEAVEGAAAAFARLKRLTSTLEKKGSVNKKYLKKFEERIADDLDMPGAVAVLWTMLRDEKATGKRATVAKMDEVFGLGLLDEEVVDIPDEVRRLVDEREVARRKKNWKRSDELRDTLSSMGWKVEDEKEGYVIERVL